MRRTIRVIFLLFAVVTGFSFQQPAKDDTNSRLKAVFIYNFSKYVEWPDKYKEGNFVITVCGASPNLSAELKNITNSKTLGAQKYEIRTVADLESVGHTNILFIGNNAGMTMNEVTTRMKGKSMLLVTEKPGMTKQGAAINFVVVENKQKFELNQANAEKYNLKVGNDLIALAIPVK